MTSTLFVLTGDGYRLEVIRLEDLIAVQTANIVHSVPPRNQFGASVHAIRLHKDRNYTHSKPKAVPVKPLYSVRLNLCDCPGNILWHLPGPCDRHFSRPPD